MITIKNKFSHLSKIALLCASILITNNLSAQWAGEDKIEIFDSNNPITVTIGTPDPNTKVCYTWSCTQPYQTMLTSIHEPELTVQIDSCGTYTYLVKRVSSNGVEEDEVKVEVRDCIIITRFEPKVECFDENQDVSSSQFYIETDPPGYEGKVTITPIKTPTNSSGTPIESRVFTAELICEKDPSHVEQDTCHVDVIKSSPVSELSSTIHVVEVIEDCLGDFCKAQKNPAVKKVTNFLDKMGKGILGKTLPCSPSFSADYSVPSKSTETFCCEGTEQYGLRIFSIPALELSAGVNCRFPLPIAGIPCKAIRLLFEIKGGVKFGPFADLLLTIDNSCGTDELPVSFYLDVAAGIGAGIEDAEDPSEALIGISAKLDANLSLGCKWKIGEGLDLNNLCLTLNVVGEFSFIGYSETYTRNICTVYF